MKDELINLHKIIATNRRNKTSYCQYCLLNNNQKYSGPVFFESVGNKPKIMIISESPAGFNLVGCDASRIQEWKERILNHNHSKPLNADFRAAYTMEEFLPTLTNNKIFSDKAGYTSGDFYWTHTVKCFIQENNSRDTIERAKTKLGESFEKICQCCSRYLIDEYSILRPEIVICLGKHARESASSFSKARIITLSHPARMKYLEDDIRKNVNVEKNKKILENILQEYGKAREMVMDYLNTNKNSEKKYFIGLVARSDVKNYCLKEGLFVDVWKLTHQEYEKVNPGDIGIMYDYFQDALIGIFEAEGRAKIREDLKKFGDKFKPNLSIKVRQIEDFYIPNAKKLLESIGIQFDNKVPKQRVFEDKLSNQIKKLIDEHKNDIQNKREEIRKNLAEKIENEILRDKINKKIEYYRREERAIYSFNQCPEMVDHGLDHSERVIVKIKELIDACNISLNDMEIYVLIIAAYLHDIGLSGPFDSLKPKHIIRKEHGKYSRQIIEHTPGEFGFEDNEDEVCKCVSEICEYHQNKNKDDLNELKDHNISGRKVRKDLVTAILRIADACDLGGARTGTKLFRVRNREWCDFKANNEKNDPKEREYYERQRDHFDMHDMIKGTKIEADYIEIIYNGNEGDEKHKENAKKMVENDLNVCRSVLEKYGIKINEVKIKPE